MNAILVFCLFTTTFIFQLIIMRGFPLIDLLDKPWSQVSYLLLPGSSLNFLSSIGFGIPTAAAAAAAAAVLVDVHRMNVADSRSCALPQLIF